jgi:hypothetical protein
VIVLGVCIIAGAIGCQPKPPPKPQQTAEERAVAKQRWDAFETTLMQSMYQRMTVIQGTSGVSHVVLCWLNNPGDAAARQKLMDASHTFTSIPGVAAVSAGTPLPSTRPVVDSSFDVGVVIEFDNEAALHAYEQNPIHQKAVAEVLRPLTRKIVIYDFANTRPTPSTRPTDTALENEEGIKQMLDALLGHPKPR